jgi:hypothetical protein
MAFLERPQHLNLENPRFPMLLAELGSSWLLSQIIGIAEVVAALNGRGVVFRRHIELHMGNIIVDASHSKSAPMIKLIGPGMEILEWTGGVDEGLGTKVSWDTESLDALYQAPELVSGGYIVPNTCVWNLGCLLLRLVIWFLRGRHTRGDMSTEDAETDLPVFEALRSNVSHGIAIDHAMQKVGFCSLTHEFATDLNADQGFL